MSMDNLEAQENQTGVTQVNLNDVLKHKIENIQQMGFPGNSISGLKFPKSLTKGKIASSRVGNSYEVYNSKVNNSDYKVTKVKRKLKNNLPNKEAHPLPSLNRSNDQNKGSFKKLDISHQSTNREILNASVLPKQSKSVIK